MKINTKATNITITPQVSDYLDKKVQSFTKFVDPNDTTAMLDVELAKTTKHHQAGDVFRAELNLNMKGASLRAEAESSDMYSAIDIAQDQMLQELRTKKERKMHFVRRGGQKLKKIIKGFYGGESDVSN